MKRAATSGCCRGSSQLVQDVKYGGRILAKHPIVTAAAILSLGLASGASIAAFGLIDALILRPLPVRQPERLAYLAMRNVEAGANEVDSFSYPLFQRLDEAARPHAELFGASYPWPHSASIDRTQSEDERASAQWISGRAFGVLGITPAVGRVLTADDDRNPGQSPVAVALVPVLGPPLRGGSQGCRPMAHDRH